MNNRQHTVLIQYEPDAITDDEPQEVSDDSPVGESERVYDEDSLSDMTTKEIKALAAERGYKITKFNKSDVIKQFLEAQG